MNKWLRIYESHIFELRIKTWIWKWSLQYEFWYPMKTQMKTTRVLDHISKPCVVFICVLTGNLDSRIKTKQIEHKNNTLVKLIIIINQLHCQFIFFSSTKMFTSQFVNEEAFIGKKPSELFSSYQLNFRFSSFFSVFLSAPNKADTWETFFSLVFL